MKNSQNILTLTSEETNYIINSKIKKKNKCFSFHYHLLFLILITSLLFLNLIFTSKIYINQGNSYANIKEKNIDFLYKDRKHNSFIPITNILNHPLETYDLKVLDRIENKIKDYIELTPDEMKFFNGILRKIKPKKVVEIGVSRGGLLFLF